MITSTTTQVTNPQIAKLLSQIITTNQRHIFRFSKRPNTQKHKYVDTTYPLDSLASDRALGSTCPLLSGLIHQLPTLKIHTKTQTLTQTHIKKSNPNLKNPQTNTNPYPKNQTKTPFSKKKKQKPNIKNLRFLSKVQWFFYQGS